jgi:hypothetical protein
MYKDTFKMLVFSALFSKTFANFTLRDDNGAYAAKLLHFADMS